MGSLDRKVNTVIVRGGGDLATGVALCLHQAGYLVIVTELTQPMVVRRKVSFAEAIFEKEVTVEGVKARFVNGMDGVEEAQLSGAVAVLVDPNLDLVKQIDFIAIVDCRMLKRHFEPDDLANKTIGLGPGFVGGINCLAAIETNRGKELGKIFSSGEPQADTGVPSEVEGKGLERVLYSPTEGKITAFVEIGSIVRENQVLAEVDGIQVKAPFDGTLRGMIRSTFQVNDHTKIGDVDPRLDSSLAFHVSDKAWAVGRSVVEVIRLMATTKG